METTLPAPLGNKNSTLDKRLFAQTIRRIAVQNDGKALREVGEALFVAARGGDVQAAKEIGDRLDGKVPQGIVGPDNGPVQIAEVPWLKGRDLAGR